MVFVCCLLCSDNRTIYYSCSFIGRLVLLPWLVAMFFFQHNDLSDLVVIVEKKINPHT